MKFLAISGSLRAASLNSALLRAVARLAPADFSVELSRSLGDLPLFYHDIDDSDPLPVANLRTQILSADALLIASPEYAHGVTGVMINALDWMVGCEAFVHNPVALLNASPRAVHAQARIARNCHCHVRVLFCCCFLFCSCLRLFSLCCCF